MPLDVSATEPSDSPDVIRACAAMTAAGLAVAVLPYALQVGLVTALALWHGMPAFDDGDVSGVARVMLLCTLAAGLGVVALGLRAAWQARRELRALGSVGVWLVVLAGTLVAWCWPPLWAFSTVWMFVGATLATRPLRWALAASGPMTPSDTRLHVRLVLGLAAGITVLSHVAVWLAVVGTAAVVPPEEFARVEAIRRGQAVERRAWDDLVAASPAGDGGIDFIEMVQGGGAVAAGRYVGGDMSHWQLSLGYWPELAQALIAPSSEGPSFAESWYVAALAFVLSLAFWLPWMILWARIGASGARAGTAAPGAP